MNDGLINLSLLGKGHTEIAVGFGVIRIDLDGLVIVFNRFIKLALGGEGVTQVVLRFSAIRIDPDGLAKVLYGFI